MKLFIAGLPYDMDDREFGEIFGDYGKIKSAAIVINKQTRQSRGFGFVEFHDAANALKAMEELHRSTLEGKAITVKPADNKFLRNTVQAFHKRKL
jgi:cold-inducible RNA-binding protein